MNRIKAFIRGRLLKLIGGLSRRLIAYEYLKGEGLEIGVLAHPLELPCGARVRYVDRLSLPELRKHYPELTGSRLVPVDILDDGQFLTSVADGSQDFIIANHFLEHCDNPIQALKTIFRVLRAGGIAYLAIPDKRFTFDKDRSETGPEHLLKDYKEGPAGSRKEHFNEWVRKVEKIKDEEAVRGKTEYLMGIGYSIHFHVFTQNGMLGLIAAARAAAGVEFELRLFVSLGAEMVFVLEKAGGGDK